MSKRLTRVSLSGPSLGIVLVAGALVATGCAINPATGKRQLMLMSESTEVQLGRENDSAVVAQMGVYEDAELEQYIDELGQDLAAISERPHLDWTFRLVDDPVVNAFALPGGYIYVTRGILAHLDNEAELVSVLGHEIGHVTARHGANQMSKAQLANVSMNVGMVLAPEEIRQFGDVFASGMGLLFLKFGRDDERQADDLGLRYLVGAGYDPRPMPGVFDTLDRVTEASGSDRIPAWMSTHPAPEDRSARMHDEIAELGGGFEGRPVHRDEYLEKIDGMAFGDDPRQGFFRDDLFLHPSLDFQLQFPHGWDVKNMRQAVIGKSAKGDAMVTLSLAREATPAEALEAFFADHDVARMPPKMGAISGLPTSGMGFKVAVDQGTLTGRVGFVKYGDNVYQLIGYSAEPAWPSYETEVRNVLASFRPLVDQSARNAKPKRIQIVRPNRGMTIEEFAREYGSSVTVDKLLLINRLDPGQLLEAGRDYKVVTGGFD
jgi:predicted Zn-dependent protease